MATSSTAPPGGSLASDLGVLHRYLLAASAALVALVGVGLAFGVDGLTRGRPEWPQIYPYTVFGLAALVVAMTLLDRGGRGGAIIGRSLAAVVIALGAGVELAVSAGILPSADPQTSDGASLITVLPSVASVAVAASVLMLGLGRARSSLVRFWLAGFAGVVTALSLLSYVYGSASIFHHLGLSGTSLPTSVIGLLLTGSVITARPDQPPLSGLDERYDRALVRRVLPPLAAVPFLPALVSWVILQVEPDAASANAVAQLVTVVFLLAIVAVAGGGQSRARRELATERQRLWDAFAHTPAPTAVIALDGSIEIANAALARLLARTEADLVGTPIIEAVGTAYRKDVAEGLAGVIAGQEGFSLDAQLTRGSGGRVWVGFGAAPVLDSAGNVTYAIVQCNDLTDRKHLERVLADQAARDPLTGLLNREGLAQRLRDRRATRPPGQAVAVVFADVDGLKPLNDSVGHAAGDDLLREVARRLLSCTRDEDIVARVGGDEFIVVTSLADDRVDSIEPVVSRLRGELSGQVAVGGQLVNLSVSLGASLLDEGDHDASTAVARADQAMYADKQRQRSRDRP